LKAKAQFWNALSLNAYETRQAAVKDLADAARRVDKAAFGEKADFGPAHQALLKALDQAGDFI
jgi:hypothetical protein